jgi:methionyl-tRNA formyltransferase
VSYVYLANNQLASQVLQWLVARGERPIGMVVHSPERAKCRDEILELAHLPPDRVLEAPELRKAAGLAWLEQLQPDWLLSVLFGHRLLPAVLTVPRKGAVNLHPALLPYNRGAHPNVWSIVDGTPAGVTMHFMDACIDAGDIIAQREVPVEPTDTGATLYARLEQSAFELFAETWPALCADSYLRQPQTRAGTFHRLADVEAIDRICPDQHMTARQLVDILRARTFPPHKGAYLDLGDRRIYLRLELVEETG